jgi:hypothetical protein
MVSDHFQLFAFDLQILLSMLAVMRAQNREQPWSLLAFVAGPWQAVLQGHVWFMFAPSGPDTCQPAIDTVSTVTMQVK